MDTVNAIAKARFASAKVQRIQLHKSDDMNVELLCLEPGQKAAASGRLVYYVVTGSATVSTASGPVSLATGHVGATSAHESHTVANESEGRLVLLAVECRAP
jgi:mannose-6-phosphate isomerase-like protein (cupin superfamily)